MMMMVFFTMLMIIELSILFCILWFLFRFTNHYEAILDQLSDFFSSKLSCFRLLFFLTNFRWRLFSNFWCFFILWFVAWFLVILSVSILPTSISSLASSRPLSTVSSSALSLLFLILWFLLIFCSLSWSTSSFFLFPFLSNWKILSKFGLFFLIQFLSLKTFSSLNFFALWFILC